MPSPKTQAPKSGRSGNPWVLFLGAFLTIGITLIARHCYPNPKVLQQSQHQYWRKVNLRSTRGIIQDAKGNALVISESKPTFAVDPSLLTSEDVMKISAVISPEITQKIYSAMKTPSKFMWLDRKPTENEAKYLTSLRKDIRGIIQIDEPYRKYTNQRLMSHVLGFCDIDNRGQAGVEQAWDTTLYNPPGQKVVVRRAGTQTASMFERNPERRTVTPVITLTLDSRIQYVVEKHLFRTAEHESVKWAAAVCMNPITGELYAMASYPTYDPENRKSLELDALSNGVISRGYEPGSTFKPIYMGIALDRGIVETSEIFHCQARYKVADGYITEATAGLAMGDIDTEGLLIKSSNVGMAQIGVRANRVQIYDSLQALGFGHETDIELPGVSKGILPYPENWWGITPANIAIGQGLAVTPLQLTTAMAAVVNGGKLMSPYVVKSAVNSQGEEVYKGEPKVLREVFSPETASWLRGAMRNVVLEGTGKRAGTDIVDVAGKTGTAQVSEGGKYSATRYVASFIGFWPYEDPKYLLLIVLGEPSAGRYYGGELATPVFKSIVEEMAELEYFS